jgi:hypothetical protein
MARPFWMPKQQMPQMPPQPGSTFHNLHIQTGGWGPFPDAYHGIGRLVHGKLPHLQQMIALASLYPGRGAGGGRQLVGPSNPRTVAAPTPRPPMNPQLLAIQQQRMQMILRALRSGAIRA